MSKSCVKCVHSKKIVKQIPNHDINVQLKNPKWCNSYLCTYYPEWLDVSVDHYCSFYKEEIK